VSIRKLVIVLAVLVAAYQFGIRGGVFPAISHSSSHDSEVAAPANADSLAPHAESSDALADAYERHLSRVQVEASGVVSRVLADDNDGSRHQRFIARMPSGQTVLIAHNIDLAPRIEGLRAGDTISFSGEYEWNDRGGVVHWTHHDPSGRHSAGWLKHDGRVYQ
jgi:hypothetical protein